MDDEELFEQRMASLGVEPLDDQGGEEQSRQREALSEEDRRLFEQAMRGLGDPAEGEGSRPPKAALPPVRRVKARQRERIGDHIDLHRLQSAEAMKKLGRFVAEARSSGVRTVLVITGKGHHSPGGRSVLKQRVEQWLAGSGRRSVTAFSEAPRNLGGRGAYVLYLRPVKAPS